MKRILFTKVQIGGADLDAIDILMNLAKAPAPGRGFDLGEMRDRIKVLDKLDAARGAGFVDLEDAEHATLSSVLSSSSYTLADRHLLTLLDGCINAAAAPIVAPVATPVAPPIAVPIGP